MKKVLKNILKWLVCVFLTFSVVFTISQSYEIAEGVYYYKINSEKFYEYEFTNEYEEMIIAMEENAENAFNNENTDERIRELYNKYPIGTVGMTMFMSGIESNLIMFGEATEVSMILALIIGTAIYLLLDKDRKGLKAAIIAYILVIVISGFIYGFLEFYGQELNFFWDYCYLPYEYILLATIAFVLIIAVRYMKQKNIANILNEKLKNNNKEKTDK